MKVNLRYVRMREKRFGRQVMASLRGGKGLPEGSNVKQTVESLLKLAFAQLGLTGLEERKTELEALLSVEDVETAWIAALLYSGQAERAHATVQECIARRGASGWLLNRLVETSLLVCDLDMARQAIKDAVRFYDDGSRLTGQVAGWLVRKLLLLDLGEWLFEEGPLILRGAPLAQWWQRLKPAQSATTPALVINMDRDTDRLRLSQALVSEFVAYKRTSGLPGSAFPDALLAAANMPIEVPRRAQIGCHMSHFRAWELYARDLEPGEYGLVLEDDGFFSLARGRGLQEAVELAKRDDLDVLYVNAEVTNRVMADPQAGPQTAPMIAAFEGSRPPPGWGGCGYLLSKAGAAKMVDMHLNLGVLVALDWQIALYGILDFSALETHSRYGSVPERLEALRAKDAERFTMRAAIAAFPVIFADDMGYKTHNVEQMITATS